jgi:peptide/nickel transport system substrate-binding protein
MSDRKLKRRQFLQLAAGAAVGAAVTACGGAPTPEVIEKTVEVEKVVEKTVEVEKVVEKTVEVEVEAETAEPPMLQPMVEAGDLPPLSERIPLQPAVVSGREAIGTYGGEVRMVHFDPVWFVSEYGWNSDRLLHYSDLDLRTIIPNVFESWEASDDGTTYTFYMRKGMKWSDGEPVTTEDFAFWWFDVATNEDLSSGVGWHYRWGGETMDVEIIDDFSFRITFADSFGQFPAHMTRWMWLDWILPKHYLSQFHGEYADTAELQGMADEMEVEGWEQVFWNKNGWGINIWQGPENATEFPTLSPWLIADNPEEGLYIWDRNPYYWKTDQVGNQLPYIDNLRIDYVASTEGVMMKAIQSEVDYLGPHDVSIARYPLYKENEPDANFQVGDYLSCMTDRYVLFPQHWLADDEVLQEIVNHPNWVRALSLAIDREEINESLYFGLARMGQLGPMPNSKYYKPAYGEAWADYDPDQANQLLDEMGLTDRDADGFRLRPDGERLTYNIEHAGERVGVATHEFTEMVVTFWRDIGIDASTKQEQESLYNERLVNGQVHVGVWHADRCTDLLLPLEMRWYLPIQLNQGGPSQAWAQWYQAADRDDPELVEPPEEIQQLLEWHDQMNVVTSESERVEIGQQIFDYLAEYPLSIGSVLECPAPLLLNQAMRNLPRPRVPVGWDTYGISTYHPEAFFYEGGERA